MPRQKQVKIGIVGLGPRGRLSWMKNLLRIKTCRVTALCDRVEALVGSGVPGGPAIRISRVLPTMARCWRRRISTRWRS